MREERPPERTEEADGQNPSEVFVGITSQFFVDQILPLIPSERNIGLISRWEIQTWATNSDSSQAINEKIDPDLARDYHEGRNEDEGNLLLSYNTTALRRTEKIGINSIPDLPHTSKPLRVKIVRYIGHSDEGFSVFKEVIKTVINPSTSDFLADVNVDFSQSEYKLTYSHDKGKVLLFKPSSKSGIFNEQQQELKDMFDKIKTTLEAESVDLKVEKAAKLSLINSQLYNASYVIGAMSLLVLQNPGLLAKVTAGISALYSGIGIANTQGIDNAIIELNKKIRGQRKVLIKE